ncbi:MAG: hypothetical protein IPJ43_06335 [Saprospiraceae bacterium]|nr:hypothetical protein [Saprospiraceae bacterium]
MQIVIRREAWSEFSFDHDVQTKFKLELSHKKSIVGLSFEEKSAGSYVQDFKNKVKIVLLVIKVLMVISLK